MAKTIQEKILEEYKDFLHFKANQYSKMGLEYEDVFSEGYLALLENYPAYGHVTSSLKRKADSHLRAYYRQEIRENHVNYGADPVSIERLIYGENPEDIIV